LHQNSLFGAVAISSHILSVKRIELLKEVLPKIQRFGVLWSAESASQRITLEHMRAAAARLGLELHAVEVSNVGALEGAFEKLSEGA
jgi:putative tryptophan/tyrosine transport system substrate-binding protein